MMRLKGCHVRQQGDGYRRRALANGGEAWAAAARGLTVADGARRGADWLGDTADRAVPRAS